MAELKDTKNNQRKRPLVSAYSTSLPDSAQGARRVNQVPLKLQILQHKRLAFSKKKIFLKQDDYNLLSSKINPLIKNMK